jgi:predicted transcriptional regulator
MTRLSPQTICEMRCQLVRWLRERGGTVRAVAQIMRLTPEEVRRYEAKARRLYP